MILLNIDNCAIFIFFFLSFSFFLSTEQTRSSTDISGASSALVQIRDGASRPPWPPCRSGLSSLWRSPSGAPLNATSVAKCKQLTCLCAFLSTEGDVLETSPTAKKKKTSFFLFRCKEKKKKRKGRVGLQRAGGGRERHGGECILLRKIQSVQSQTSVVSHRWTGYTSLGAGTKAGAVSDTVPRQPQTRAKSLRVARTARDGSAQHTLQSFIPSGTMQKLPLKTFCSCQEDWSLATPPVQRRASVLLALYDVTKGRDRSQASDNPSPAKCWPCLVSYPLLSGGPGKQQFEREHAVNTGLNFSRCREFGGKLKKYCK